ncbi:unnamed protein product [Rotaria sp. Silwood2]|nr:unnamed protein product [Rotaria sp. Silwood2]CAF4503680.1 unnamed protein product [Rotaria sp. Silwood2]CAF4519888.1 unnamed protein product [Rotaria sp. Silwood2]
MPLLPLEKAVEPIVSCCPDIHRRVFIAMSNCENSADGLDQNESAAIFLYTMEWEPRDECLYYVLNKILRTENRQKLKPWYSYLRLILNALQKLPPQKLTVWRGVPLDLNQQYEIGKRYVWWAFSSCTRSLAVLESEQFLGKHGPRTLFNIECQNGKTIRSHSYIDVEDEILLLPAAQFEVISKLKPSSDLNIIHLRQVDPPFPLIELPLTTMTVRLKSHFNKDEEQLPNSYQNDKLEQLIYTQGHDMDLKRQELIDNDIPIVIQRAIIDKKCSYLNLRSNKITEEGAQCLAKVLQSHTSLSMLQIAENKVGDGGVHLIAQALYKNTHLNFLDLTNNNIKHKGAQSLAEALRANSTLESLYIGANQIGDSGAQCFSAALKHNTTLKTLSLDITGVTDNGTIYLAEMLTTNTNLTNLYLDNNNLTNSGVKILMDAVCNNHGLKRLDIRCSQMTKTTIPSPTTATSSNKCSDFYLACRNNKIEEVQALLETMDTNDIDRVEPNGMTALHAACFHGHLEIVKLLLMVGADRAIQSKYGNLPFGEARTDEIKELFYLIPNSNRLQSNKGTIEWEIIDDDDIVDDATQIRHLLKSTFDSTSELTSM